MSTAPHPAAEQAPGTDGVFAVHLDNFEGPFDLLLQLISHHELDVTEIALSRVTDEFVAQVRAAGESWDLDRTTSFLVVAATLLDLKAVRLLPSAEVEDAEDLALLEARDLLFARLLQYRAFKTVAGLFAERLAAEDLRVPRSVILEERFAQVLPDVLISVGLAEFAALAGRVLALREPEIPEVAHLHANRVSVREQAAVVAARVRRMGTTTFRALVRDAPDTLTTVARFLAVLELFKEAVVAFEQVSPLGELTIRWTGTDADVCVEDEYDEPAPAVAAAQAVSDADIARMQLAAGPNAEDAAR